MNYLQRLYELTCFAKIKSSLANVALLNEACGFPEKSFRSIHVAGTNGKGSVSLKIAKALQYSGYKVGLYTSPHISSFRERIAVNDQPISEEQVKPLLEKLFSTADKLSLNPTFFEVTTLTALLHFAKERVDFALMEVGLGGRLDATNIITPCLSVITSISFDHKHILGNTLEEIAFEKAGIIKKQVPVVVGTNVPLPIFQKIAKEKQAELLQAPFSLHSFYDAENNATAKTALYYLQKKITLPDEAIAKALLARPKCRLEILGPSQLTGLPLGMPKAVVLDVAHNPDAFTKLFHALHYHFPDQNFRFLLGFSKDKDILGCLQKILSNTKGIHLVCTENMRLEKPKKLEAMLHSIGFKVTSTSENVITEVHKAAKLAAQEKEILVITGSFFIMSQARKALGFNEPQDEFEFQEKYSLYSE